MKLKAIQVKNFRSVEDSGEFAVGATTCLVGKNEAGKTAILQALESFNPADLQHSAPSVTRDYPRRFLNQYKERHDGEEAPYLVTKWEFEDD